MEPSAQARQQLKSLVEAYKRGEDTKAMLAKLTPAERLAVQQMIGTRKKEIPQEVWQTQRKLREIDAKKMHYEEDLRRLRLYGAGTRLWQAFSGIFADPQQAAKKCSQLEQKYGPEKMEKILRRHPSRLGRLKGFNLFGVKLGERQKALARCSRVAYANLRNRFEFENRIHTKLKQLMRMK